MLRRPLQGLSGIFQVVLTLVGIQRPGADSDTPGMRGCDSRAEVIDWEDPSYYKDGRMTSDTPNMCSVESMT